MASGLSPVRTDSYSNFAQLHTPVVVDNMLEYDEVTESFDLCRSCSKSIKEGEGFVQDNSIGRVHKACLEKIEKSDSTRKAKESRPQLSKEEIAAQRAEKKRAKAASKGEGGKKLDKLKRIESPIQAWQLSDFAKVDYSHPTISGQTRDQGGEVEKLSMEALKGKIKENGWKTDEPLEIIAIGNGRYTSWNNRRLYCLKELYKEALQEKEGAAPWKVQRGITPQRNRPSGSPNIEKNDVRPVVTKIPSNFRNRFIYVRVVDGNTPIKKNDLRAIQETLKLSDQLHSAREYDKSRPGCSLLERAKLLELNPETPTWNDKLAVRAAIDLPILDQHKAQTAQYIPKTTNIDFQVPIGYSEVEVRS